MTLNDIEHLPKIVTDIDGINDVLEAIDPELTQLRLYITELMNELYVKTTNQLIRRWELDFSLPYDASLTLEQRRQRILNKLARKKTLTWANLSLLVRNNLPINTLFYIANKSSDYAFRILVASDNYEEMRKAVMQAKPAYLTFDILETDVQRRCGTFNCGTEPL